MDGEDEYDPELAAARQRDAMWGKIGHPVQSRGLSPKDRTPWLTLIATGCICLVLGKLFLNLQRNYEADFGLWQVNLDLDGFAVSWGLDFKTPTAQACCDACRAHEKRDGQPGKCNSWVWCPEDKCWAPDIWDHRLHECWLKVQDDPASPKVNHRGAFSDAFRAEHKTAPEKTPWMAGVLL